MTKRSGLGIAASALLGMASAFAALPASAADGPFVVNYSLPPPTLDPSIVCDIADDGFIASLYTPLLRYEAKPVTDVPAGVTVTTEDTTKVVGYLAESYSVSDDGRTLTFKLRPGLKFPSGNPLDAAAVKASLEFTWKSGTCGTYFFEAAQFGNTEAIEAPDATTVVIKLKRGEPLVLHALTQPNTGIIDLKAVEANGGKTWLASNAAGSGPYVLASYEPGVRAVFKANPDFFGTPPIEPEVIVNFVTDNATLLLQARNGQADVTLGLSKASVASLAESADLKVIKVPTARWQLVGFPNKKAPFDNAKFRAALSYAVPYEPILANVAHGLGTIFYGPYPPAFPAFNAEIAPPRSYDLDKAKALLAESGVATPVAADIVIREGQNDQEQIATILQGAWSQLGVNLSIRKLAASAYQEAVGAETKEALIVRFDGPSVDDPAWLLDYDMRCKSAYNTSNYCNAEAEALLDKGHATADAAARQVIWDDIAKIWIADSPRVPIYADTYTAVVSGSVKEWHFAQDGPFDLDQWGRR
ncbi:ABC transporter substrate-binding protein [Prosthecomicrobium pneumaticum]|uniref:Peptide/nickel transport system substrate-binding protein n=1 Tax=Prosthecomicrobium pneumaticum TaxID=81895 RepID=A0A7W9CU18_9HYPH|nr:ABC transporter substrate-binding protein [Prosthecomicrobium pneumaticum]MBB5751621.1 peptide/nickel transport system substrate-binding protein [Prosthecomicrobium pneumaticum]